MLRVLELVAKSLPQLKHTLVLPKIRDLTPPAVEGSVPWLAVFEGRSFEFGFN
jgi:hypothetical protein